MRRSILFIILAGMMLGAWTPLWSQQDADTSRRELPGRELPPIQLQDYTIVGLAKITLPGKVRTEVFKDVDIYWKQNMAVYQKEPPAITFQFSRIKPSLFRLYEFPWLDSRMYYGSYNTAGMLVNTQFQAQKTLPYLSVNYDRSDGHLPNAQWNTVGMRAGLHHELRQRHLLSAGTDYSLTKQGIWGEYETFQQDWETRTGLWSLFAGLESRWNEKISTVLGGIYFTDEFKNVFQYEDRGYDIYGSLNIDVRDTRFGLSMQQQTMELTFSEGNVPPAQPDSALREYQASLFSAEFDVQQKLQLVTAKAGINYQQSEERQSSISRTEFDNEYVYPFISLSLGFQGKGSLYARYRPGAELFRLRDAVHSMPFSDPLATRTIDYHKRWEAGFDVNAPAGLLLNVVSRYSEARYYPAPVGPADSLNVVFPIGAYPGWVFGAIDRVKIQEIQGKIDWYFIPALRLQGLANYRQSDIRETGAFPEAIEGNEIPYFSKFSGAASLSWNFYRDHELILSLEYMGERFDDLQNQIKLKSYFLGNARVNLKLSENLRIFIAGRNLFDTVYEEWKGFTAPGITGLVGLQWTM